MRRSATSMPTPSVRCKALVGHAYQPRECQCSCNLVQSVHLLAPSSSTISPTAPPTASASMMQCLYWHASKSARLVRLAKVASMSVGVVGALTAGRSKCATDRKRGRRQAAATTQTNELSRYLCGLSWMLFQRQRVSVAASQPLTSRLASVTASLKLP